MHGHVVAFVQYEDAAGLVLVIVAMVAMLILGALWLLVTFLGGIFRHIPFVGRPIAAAFDAAARALRSAILGTLHGTLWAGKKLFDANVAFFRNTFGIIHNALNALAHAVEHVVNVIIRREIRQVRDRITRVKHALLFEIRADYRHLLQLIQSETAHRKKAVDDARHDLGKHIDQVDANAKARDKALDKSLSNRISQAVDNLTAKIHDAVTSLRQQITARFNDAEDFTRAKFSQAEHDIAIAKQDAENYADRVSLQQYRHALQTVDSEAGNAAATVWPEITAMAGTLRHDIADAFPDVGQLLQDVPAHTPQDLAAAIVAAIRIVPPLMKLADDCTIPQCRDLGSTRQQIHNLQLPVTSAALIAWFIEMVTAPEAWADQTYAFLRPLIAAEYDVLTGFLRI